MSLEGRTIVRVESDWYAQVLHFDDGTALRLTGNWEAYQESLSPQDVREQAALEQGKREEARMLRLHDMLHPRDKQWLALQAREARQRADVGKEHKTLSAFSAALKQEFLNVIRDSQLDLERAIFSRPQEYPRLKRKHRPVSHDHPEFVGHSFTIPVKRAGQPIAFIEQSLDD